MEVRVNSILECMEDQACDSAAGCGIPHISSLQKRLGKNFQKREKSGLTVIGVGP
jgi:hypothetical protein